MINFEVDTELNKLTDEQLRQIKEDKSNQRDILASEIFECDKILQNRACKTELANLKNYIGKCFKIKPNFRSYYADVVAFQILEFHSHRWSAPSAECLTIVKQLETKRSGIIIQNLHLWSYNNLAKMFKSSLVEKESVIDCYEEISLQEFKEKLSEEYSLLQEVVNEKV